MVPNGRRRVLCASMMCQVDQVRHVEQLMPSRVLSQRLQRDPWENVSRVSWTLARSPRAPGNVHKCISDIKGTIVKTSKKSWVLCKRTPSQGNQVQKLLLQGHQGCAATCEGNLLDARKCCRTCAPRDKFWKVCVRVSKA